MKRIITLIILSILISCSLQKKTSMKKKHFNFYTDYHQFYLQDGSDKNNEDRNSPEFWSEEAFSKRMALAKGIIGVGIQSYGSKIKGEIEILDNPHINVFIPYT